MVITRRELIDLTPLERAELVELLHRMNIDQAPPWVPRRRTIFVALTAACSAILVAWIFVLGVTLPPTPPHGAWRSAWIGLDSAEAVSFAIAAWAAWRRRQIAIAAAVIAATLLLCDAWFDITLSWHTDQQAQAVIAAIVVELPLATLLLLGARRMVVVTLTIVRGQLGLPGRPPALRRLVLFEPYFDIVAQTAGAPTDRAPADPGPSGSAGSDR